MDVNSGSIHVADDLVYEIVPLVEELAGAGVKERDLYAGGSSYRRGNGAVFSQA